MNSLIPQGQQTTSLLETGSISQGQPQQLASANNTNQQPLSNDLSVPKMGQLDIGDDGNNQVQDGNNQIEQLATIQATKKKMLEIRLIKNLSFYYLQQAPEVFSSYDGVNDVNIKFYIYYMLFLGKYIDTLKERRSGSPEQARFYNITLKTLNSKATNQTIKSLITNISNTQFGNQKLYREMFTKQLPTQNNQMNSMSPSMQSFLGDVRTNPPIYYDTQNRVQGVQGVQV